MLSTPSERAVAAGLAVRPLVETVAGTLEWIAAEEHEQSDPRPAGLARAKEQAVLAAWSARTPGSDSAGGSLR
jgi:hypothetical protein